MLRELLLQAYDAMIYNRAPAGHNHDSVKIPLQWFAPEVIAWLKKRDAEKQAEIGALVQGGPSSRASRFSQGGRQRGQ